MEMKLAGVNVNVCKYETRAGELPASAVNINEKILQFSLSG